MLAIGAFQNEAHAQDPDSDATVDSIMVLTITEDFSAGPFVTLTQSELPWVGECLTGALGSKATVTTNTPISGSGASPCFEILSPDPFQYRIVTVDGGATERWMDLYCGDEITIRIMKANNS